MNCSSTAQRFSVGVHQIYPGAYENRPLWPPPRVSFSEGLQLDQRICTCNNVSYSQLMPVLLGPHFQNLESGVGRGFARRYEFKFWLFHLLSMWLWASYFISLSLGFLTRKRDRKCYGCRGTAVSWCLMIAKINFPFPCSFLPPLEIFSESNHITAYLWIATLISQAKLKKINSPDSLLKGLLLASLIKALLSTEESSLQESSTLKLSNIFQL